MPSKYIADLTKTLKSCTTLGDFKTKFVQADLNETQTDLAKARQFTDFLLEVQKGVDLEGTLTQIKDKFWKHQYTLFQKRVAKLSELEALVYCPHNLMEIH